MVKSHFELTNQPGLVVIAGRARARVRRLKGQGPNGAQMVGGDGAE